MQRRVVNRFHDMGGSPPSCAGKRHTDRKRGRDDNNFVDRAVWRPVHH